MSSALRIGSRPSALALAQANIIRDALAERLGGLLEIVPISTSGDKMQTASLARVGGKGLFVRELEQALSERRIDVAVLEIEPGEHVHRLGGEHLVAAGDRHVIALLTDLARGCGFAAVVMQHPQPPQRLGVHGDLPALVRDGDRRPVALHRLGDTPRALLGARVAQQLTSAARPVGARLPGDRQQRATRRQHARYQATA